MKKKIYALLTIKLPGFSLIELSVVLIIIGILAGAVLKGQDLIESAKIRRVVSDFQSIALAITTYQDTYSALPGDDAHAQRWEGVPDGNGNHKIEGDDVAKVWVHLEKAGLMPASTPPPSRFGGTYNVRFAPFDGFDGHWIILENAENTGVLTSKQAKSLKQSFEGGKPKGGQMQFSDSPIDGKKCLTDDKEGFDLSHDRTVCIVLVRLH